MSEIASVPSVTPSVRASSASADASDGQCPFVGRRRLERRAPRAIARRRADECPPRTSPSPRSRRPCESSFSSPARRARAHHCLDLIDGVAALSAHDIAVSLRRRRLRSRARRDRQLRSPSSFVVVTFCSGSDHRWTGASCPSRRRDRCAVALSAKHVRDVVDTPPLRTHLENQVERRSVMPGSARSTGTGAVLRFT